MYTINVLYLNQFFLNSHNDNDATLIRMIYANTILIFKRIIKRYTDAALAEWTVSYVGIIINTVKRCLNVV